MEKRAKSFARTRKPDRQIYLIQALICWPNVSLAKHENEGKEGKK